ncbi:DUF4855 domain-containing protein [Paenibacillus sp. KQZ6P-2]|uniref:DUF4855 domain-containing protein n=1 Tax=Paenibacillus mangrovi TaxID=2931978 RepID=A0A9X2B832_9BACL|nr:DUF4855 domain-containing protein [Paenibacillus mangrovi]MCJ8014043.1 DUF4855 domain-containing protein [Paenibacillus mangrovi]
MLKKRWMTTLLVIFLIGMTVTPVHGEMAADKEKVKLTAIEQNTRMEELEEAKGIDEVEEIEDIENTVDMKGLASKEEPGQLKNLALGLPYQLSEQPTSQYPDRGGQLTDGKKAEATFQDPNWVGFFKGHLKEVVFDLGSRKSIASINTQFLQESSASIFFPITVSFYVSDDGKRWSTLNHVGSQKQLWKNTPPNIQQYAWNGETDGFRYAGGNGTMAYARYVKVQFMADWFKFIDEIEIWGYDGKQKNARNLPPDKLAYLQPGDATVGIHDLVLIPNGYYPGNLGDWSKEDYIPYVAYIDKNGNPVDWMIDGYLIAPYRSPNWHAFNSIAPPSDKSDWEWLLNKTFDKGGDVDHLNEAVKEIGQKLGQPDHKVKVVMTIPTASEWQTDFGDVDGDGVSENFSSENAGADLAFLNKKKAIEWFVNEVMKKWENANFSHVELAGLYYNDEFVEVDTPNNEEIVKLTSEISHRAGKKLFWIPYFHGGQPYDWKELGLDNAAYQPNHFFDGTDKSRVDDAAILAKTFHTAIEMEFDDRMITSNNYAQRFLDYLNGGVEHGYMNAYRAWYQGNKTILNLANNKSSQVREYYDYLYQYIKGTYTKKELVPYHYPTELKVNDLSIPIQQCNEPREGAKVVYYDKAYGDSTRSNEWGIEFTVVDGVVTNKVDYPDRDSKIPSDNGYVISIHMDSPYYDLVKNQVKIGDRVELIFPS